MTNSWPSHKASPGLIEFHILNNAAGATSPLGGSVTGFTKSYKKERPEALVKAVDFPVSRKTAAIADVLLEETLRDPGAVEVGRLEGQRWGVGFSEVAFPALGADGSPDGEGGMPLTPESVFVVTGAAGSIVSAITADLAKGAGGGTFHLLDLTPTPDAADADLAAFRTDKDGLKATLAARMKAAGERPTPVAIDKELARIERLAAEVLAAVLPGTGRIHRRPAVAQLLQRDALHAPLVHQREQPVLVLGLAAADLVDQHRLRTPHRGWRLQETDALARLVGVRKAHEIVEGDRGEARNAAGPGPVSYTHLTLPTTHPV